MDNRSSKSDLAGLIENNILEAESIRNRNQHAESLDELSDVDVEWLINLIKILDDKKCKLPLRLARRILKIFYWFDDLSWGAD
jgi:hypothetical protein